MSEHRDDLETLDPELRTLLDAERNAPELPAHVAERMVRRGEIALGLPTTVPAPHVPWYLHRVPTTLAALLLGVAAGGFLHARFAPQPVPTVIVRTVTVSAPASPPQSAPVVQTAPVITPESAPAVIAPVHVTRDAGPALRETDLAAERAGLEIAHTALGRGNASAALSALVAHQRDFPHGQLAEERESLWVQALALAHRDDLARDRGERFIRRYPMSMFRPAVSATLRSLPPPPADTDAGASR